MTKHYIESTLKSHHFEYIAPKPIKTKNQNIDFQQIEICLIRIIRYFLLFKVDSEYIALELSINNVI